MLGKLKNLKIIIIYIWKLFVLDRRTLKYTTVDY